MSKPKIGVIGGSGLYEMKAVTHRKEVKVKTPFGPHSGPLLTGKLAGIDCAFLPRHGKGHVYLPTELNSRANIYALKSLGVERVISVSAVGSLREELEPRHFVFPDQLVDRTKLRGGTFFGDGVVAHVSFADPFCNDLSDTLHARSQKLGITSHRGGVFACMEGPLFSTRAESDFHRRQGWSIIGMTVCPEAKLAREAELCYSPVALVTDYDCWKEGEEVTSEMVIGNLTANVANAQRLLEDAVTAVADLPRHCRCGHALDGAVFTAPAARNKATLKKLQLLLKGR
jgi:5'-methylthioadenosine phosphorylase